MWLVVVLVALGQVRLSPEAEFAGGVEAAYVAFNEPEISYPNTSDARPLVRQAVLQFTEWALDVERVRGIAAQKAYPPKHLTEFLKLWRSQVDTTVAHDMWQVRLTLVLLGTFRPVDSLRVSFPAAAFPNSDTLEGGASGSLCLSMYVPRRSCGLRQVLVTCSRGSETLDVELHPDDKRGMLDYFHLVLLNGRLCRENCYVIPFLDASLSLSDDKVDRASIKRLLTGRGSVLGVEGAKVKRGGYIFGNGCVAFADTDDIERMIEHDLSESFRKYTRFDSLFAFWGRLAGRINVPPGRDVLLFPVVTDGVHDEANPGGRPLPSSSYAAGGDDYARLSEILAQASRDWIAQGKFMVPLPFFVSEPGPAAMVAREWSEQVWSHMFLEPEPGVLKVIGTEGILPVLTALDSTSVGEFLSSVSDRMFLFPVDDVEFHPAFPVVTCHGIPDGVRLDDSSATLGELWRAGDLCRIGVSCVTPDVVLRDESLFKVIGLCGCSGSVDVLSQRGNPDPIRLAGSPFAERYITFDSSSNARGGVLPEARAVACLPTSGAQAFSPCRKYGARQGRWVLPDFLRDGGTVSFARIVDAELWADMNRYSLLVRQRIRLVTAPGASLVLLGLAVAFLLAIVLMARSASVLWPPKNAVQIQPAQRHSCLGWFIGLLAGVAADSAAAICHLRCGLAGLLGLSFCTVVPAIFLGWCWGRTRLPAAAGSTSVPEWVSRMSSLALLVFTFATLMPLADPKWTTTLALLVIALGLLALAAYTKKRWSPSASATKGSNLRAARYAATGSFSVSAAVAVLCVVPVTLTATGVSADQALYGLMTPPWPFVFALLVLVGVGLSVFLS
jgi:hypothetical protein